MRAVVQRVNYGSVEIDGKTVSEISKGLVVLLGVSEQDTLEDTKYVCEKITNLRIFEDEDEKMNLSLLDIRGEMLVVSQFTLYGDCRKGRRPNFMSAAKPDKANELYVEFVKKCKQSGLKVKTGVFQADMNVRIENYGPVTIIIDSEKNF